LGWASGRGTEVDVTGPTRNRVVPR